MLRSRRSTKTLNHFANGRHAPSSSGSTSYMDYSAAISSPPPPTKSLLGRVRSTFSPSARAKKAKAAKELTLRHDIYSDEEEYNIEEDIRTPTSLGPMANNKSSSSSSCEEDGTSDDENEIGPRSTEFGPFLDLPKNGRSSASRTTSTGSGCGFDVDVEMARASAKTNGNGNTLGVVPPVHRRISLGLQTALIQDDEESESPQSRARSPEWMEDPYNGHKQTSAHKSTPSTSTMNLSGLKKSLSFRSRKKSSNGLQANAAASTSRLASPVEDFPPSLRLTLPDATTSSSLFDATFGTTSPIHRHLSAHLVPATPESPPPPGKEYVQPLRPRTSSLHHADDPYMSVLDLAASSSRSSSLSSRSMSSFLRRRAPSSPPAFDTPPNGTAQPQYRPMSLGLNFEAMLSDPEVQYATQRIEPEYSPTHPTQSTLSLLKAVNGSLSRSAPKQSSQPPVLKLLPIRKRSFKRSKPDPPPPPPMPVYTPPETKSQTPVTPRTPQTPSFRLYVTPDTPLSPLTPKRSHSIKRVPVPQPSLPTDKPQPPLPQRYTQAAIKMTCSYSSRRTLAALARVNKASCDDARRALYAIWREEQEAEFLAALPTLSQHKHLAAIVSTLHITRKGLEAVIPLAVAPTLSYGLRLGVHLELSGLRSLTVQSALPPLSWIGSLSTLEEFRLPGLKDVDVFNYIENLGPSGRRAGMVSLTLLRVFQGPPALMSLLEARVDGMSPPQSPTSAFSDHFVIRPSPDTNPSVGLSLLDVNLGPITTSLFSSPPFRPASVIRAMGTKVIKLCITFGDNDESAKIKIDRRTIDRTIDGIGALVLLETLALQLSWEMEEGDDDIYKCVTSLLPSLTRLHTLRLTSNAVSDTIELVIPAHDSPPGSIASSGRKSKSRRSAPSGSPASFAFPSPPAFAFPNPPTTGAMARLSLPVPASKSDQSEARLTQSHSRSSLPPIRLSAPPKRSSTSSTISGRQRQRPPALIITRTSSNTSTMHIQLENDNENGTPKSPYSLKTSPPAVTGSTMASFKTAEDGTSIKSPDRLTPELERSPIQGSPSENETEKPRSPWRRGQAWTTPPRMSPPVAPPPALADDSLSDTSSSDADYVAKHRLSFKAEELFYSPPPILQQEDTPISKPVINHRSVEPQDSYTATSKTSGLQPGMGPPSNVIVIEKPMPSPMLSASFPDPSFPGTPAFSSSGSGASPYEPSLMTLAQPHVPSNARLAPPLPLLNPMFFPATPNSATFQTTPSTGRQTRQKERTMLLAWVKLCPSLRSVVFLSGLEWTYGDEIGWVEPGGDDSPDSDSEDWSEDSSENSD